MLTRGSGSIINLKLTQMIEQFACEIVVSYQRETLSAKVKLLSNLPYNRFSIFFNQQLTDVGPSHMIISKRVTQDSYRWTCEVMSFIQDESLAMKVGFEIDRYLASNPLFA